MAVVWVVLASLALGSGLAAEGIGTRAAPVYTSASIVDAAANQSGPLAPNTIATVYGVNLAYNTQSLTSNDVSGVILPVVLPGTGVHVLVGSIPANLYYVSPGQINFLIPANLLPGTSGVQLVIDGLAGPLIPIQIVPASPELFQLDPQNAVATRPDGSTITPAAPAKPGDIVILYATGLGETLPPAVYSELPTSAAPLKQMADFHILLDGVAVAAPSILYAGIAPGFAGLYQINLRLPDSTGAHPEIRIGVGAALSVTGLQLPVQP